MTQAWLIWPCLPPFYPYSNIFMISEEIEVKNWTNAIEIEYKVVDWEREYDFPVNVGSVAELRHAFLISFKFIYSFCSYILFDLISFKIYFNFARNWHKISFYHCYICFFSQKKWIFYFHFLNIAWIDIF